MATKTNKVDWGGLTPTIEALEIGVTKPGKVGTGTTITAAEFVVLNDVASTTATGAELTRAADLTGRIVNITGTQATITETAHEGRIVTLDRATGIAVTLPAATGTGGVYTFVVKTANSSTNTYTLVRAGSDTIAGHALGDDGDGEPANGWTTASATTITLGGTTSASGGSAGDKVVLIDIATGVWQCSAFLTQGGSEVTPFS
jgi:hypothetical protein